MIAAVGALQQVPVPTPSLKSANIMLVLDSDFFQDITHCIAIGEIISPSSVGNPRIVPVTSQTSNISFTFTGLNEETLYGYSITISCCNSTEHNVVVYGKFTTTDSEG